MNGQYRNWTGVIGKGISLVLAGCLAFGWWGVLYPELVLDRHTYRLVSETGEPCLQEQTGGMLSSEAVYWELLNAEKGRIRFRSRLWECVTELYEGFREK